MADPVPPAASPRGPCLVPEEVTRAKFDRQLALWDENSSLYARRGWMMLSRGELTVDIGFLTNVRFVGQDVPVMTVCIRLDYHNFDLWPPSLTFIDPLTRDPKPPVIGAPDKEPDGEVRDALIAQHPTTGLPFLCIAGVREYHTHPQHSGDDWLLHRPLGEGDLAVICDRVWRRMARNVLGVTFSVQSLPTTVHVELGLNQGDPDLAQKMLIAEPVGTPGDTSTPGSTRALDRTGPSVPTDDAPPQRVAALPIPATNDTTPDATPGVGAVERPAGGSSVEPNGSH